MRTSWINTLAVAAVLGCVGLLYGQGGKTGDQGPPKPDKEAPPKTKLEEMIQQALRNNADIRVAEAKVAEAEAELNRTRQQVMQKIVLHNASVDSAKAVVQEAEDRLNSMVDANNRVRNAYSIADIRRAEHTVLSKKAELAKIEVELPLLLGTPAQGKTTDRAIEKSLEWWRRVSLDLTGDPNAWRDVPGDLVQDPETKKWYKTLGESDETSATARAIEALSAAHLKPPVQGPMAERIKKALDHEMKVSFHGKPLEVLDSLLQQIEGVPHRIQWPEGDVVGPATIDLTFKEPVALGAIFQAYQDSVASSMRLVVRDYGILVTDDKHVPPGAPLLYDVWKGGKEKKTEKVEKTTDKVEGKITSLDLPSKLVKVSVGSDAGLKKGDTLEVYRLDPNGPKYLGQLKVVEVKPTEAVAHPGTAGKDGDLKVGDNVTNQLPAK
jgi:hypothetical protein